MKLEKAGSIPLIEGYRVDLKEFRGWLDAVSKGEGKVIVWTESPPLTSLAQGWSSRTRSALRFGSEG